MPLFRRDRAIDSLLSRTDQLRDRIDALETANKRLGLEWEELYDKVRHQMSRMSKRVAVDAAANGEIPQGMDEPPGDLGIDPISAKILARRNAGRPQG